MNVIFIKDLKNVGKKGEIKNFKDGYAQNFLIKNGYAVIKNEINFKKLKKEKKLEEKQDEENTKKAKTIKTALEKKLFLFTVKTGEKDKVFGSVSAKNIKEELQKQGYEINKNQINMSSPLSTLGIHKVEIDLYKDIKAIIKIELTK